MIPVSLLDSPELHPSLQALKGKENILKIAFENGLSNPSTLSLHMEKIWISKKSLWDFSPLAIPIWNLCLLFTPCSLLVQNTSVSVPHDAAYSLAANVHFSASELQPPTMYLPQPTSTNALAKTVQSNTLSFLLFPNYSLPKSQIGLTALFFIV